VKHFLIKFLFPGFIIGVLTFGLLVVFNFNNLPFAISETVPINLEGCNQMVDTEILGGPCTPVFKFKAFGFSFDLLIFILGGIFAVLIFRRLFKKEYKKVA